MNNTMEYKRRELGSVTKKKIWIYGSPFAGKTHFADEFPNPYFINTDGNLDTFTGEYYSVETKIEMNDRTKNKIHGWEGFKKEIERLETQKTPYKTIVLDLLNDIYDFCTEYILETNKWQDESDIGYGKIYRIIKREFKQWIKRFMNLPYDNIIIISHEDTTREITKSNTNDKITQIKPKIGDDIADYISGMCKIVARIVKVSEDNRVLSFKTDRNTFGGGHMKIEGRDIPAHYEDFCKIYNDYNNKINNKK